MADSLDVDAMLSRFRDRANAVRQRSLPPVTGPERARFQQAASDDFMDYAMIGDAQWEFADGVLTLKVTLTGE